MNTGIGAPASIETVEKFRIKLLTQGLQPEKPELPQTDSDQVQISSLARTLLALSRSGDKDIGPLVQNILAGIPDSNLDSFMQAYCMVYGGAFYKAAAYDSRGSSGTVRYSDALKSFFENEARLLLETGSAESEKQESFFEWLRRLFKRLLDFFKG